MGLRKQKTLSGLGTARVFIIYVIQDCAIFWCIFRRFGRHLTSAGETEVLVTAERVIPAVICTSINCRPTQPIWGHVNLEAKLLAIRPFVFVGKIFKCVRQHLQVCGNQETEFGWIMTVVIEKSIQSPSYNLDVLYQLSVVTRKLNLHFVNGQHVLEIEG